MNPSTICFGVASEGRGADLLNFPGPAVVLKGK